MERQITLDNVHAIAIGAGILGTGGGGDPYIGRVWLEHLLHTQNTPCRVLDADDVPDDMLLCALGFMGAPTVSIEKLAQGDEFVNAIRALEAHIGKTIGGLVIAEIGGSNAFMPLACGIQMGLPIIDGDGMGRAFPELPMDTFMIAGIPLSPFSICDASGNAAVFTSIESPERGEQYARALTVQMGGTAGLVAPLMTGHQMKKAIIRRTLTLAEAIGQRVIDARQQKSDPSDIVAELCNGRVLFRGKIVDVRRRTTGGFARGEMNLVSFDDPNDTLRIVFQNENLVAWHNGEIVCTVPDLICILNIEDGEPITTELLRYGLRVAVLGLPAARELKTPKALKVVAPPAFGYPDIDFHPLPGDLLQ